MNIDEKNEHVMFICSTIDDLLINVEIARSLSKWFKIVIPVKIDNVKYYEELVEEYNILLYVIESDKQILEMADQLKTIYIHE